MKLDFADRSRVVLQLLVAEVLARPGRGPLARVRWRRRHQPPPATDAAEAVPPPPPAAEPVAER